MERVLYRKDLDEDALASLSLNTLLAEELVAPNNDSPEVNLRCVPLECPYYNNSWLSAYAYYKEIVVPFEAPQDQ